MITISWSRVLMRDAHLSLVWDNRVSMMQVNQAFMEQAIALATENVTSGRGGPFGAVIVRGGEVVATGVNRVTATNDATAHAEVVAIREAAHVLNDFQLTGCHVYT